MQAFEEVLPRVDHRFCTFTQISGKISWKAAKADDVECSYNNSSTSLGNRNDQIKGSEPRGLQIPYKIPPRYWSRSRFTTTVKCDTLVNNMSEAFNSVLVHTRSKPIITMLEEIRLY
ncbi:uncharacterized protein LOC106780256 [Vigna radiata var. radiata]|uniref:Uncharacterized protein LOC106780256 n=1 Tax=Vigna radiata var. radiata TaxID=3916 RepID=A0A3Q0EL70_VIGRR|nr:uncharacterized protein LOC106780256 [Vigna radiata var. radiata]